MQVKGLRNRDGKGCFGAFALGHLVNAPTNGLQQLAGILKVAPPQQAGTCTRQAVGAVSS
jgi:hypothetical protein